MRFRIAAIAALVGCAACASGNRDGAATDAGIGAIDAPAVVSTADAAPDGPPLGGFGDPCADGAQCTSQICVQAGTHGVCSQLCGNDCPDMYSCLGVDGAVVEGMVSFVCVPETNQLCSPCVQDSECTHLGMDKCLTFPDGEHACGEDCSTISCPANYACNDVVIDNMNYKQCEPTSGACDCTAANPGSTQPCTIATPGGGTCAGTQTCAGATGWAACAPPSTTDVPDDNYTDSNCDGIDGDASAGIFVSTGGSNDLDCGTSPNTPCQTITWGITRAQQQSFSWVYVQNGTYTGPLAMKNGINVVGGYNTTWQRNAYTVSGHTVTIMGGNPAVTFAGLTMQTSLIDVVVRGSDGSPASSTAAAGSAIGVLATSSTGVQLKSVSVTSGVGGLGFDGGSGSGGVVGGAGGNGNPGVEHSSGLCDNNPLPAPGTAGTSSCSHPGGVGGNAGVSDDSTYGGAGWGQDGASGTSGAVPGQGAHCNSSQSCVGHAGGNGANGSTGSSGTGGLSLGMFSGTSYLPSNGSAGGSGTPGQGGAGGGGGGGGTSDCDSSGSSGGGGGGGGCGGAPGNLGTGGGGSFAVVTSDSLLVIVNCAITSGAGGNGGRGGIGGVGGVGGTAGTGGPYGGSDDQDDGGNGAGGGMGGMGGNGGQGGGGGGGPSIPVVCLGSSTTMAAQSGSTLTPSSGGTGGSSSSPGAQGQSSLPDLNCTAF